MQVSDDLTRLAQHIEVPPTFSAGQWLAAPRGTPGIGPTDLMLVARFALTASQWTQLEPKLSALAESGLAIPAKLRPAVGGAARIDGAVFDAPIFTNIRWHDARAVWDGAHLTVLLFSG